MPTLVSTGQLTIVDNNDARPITAYLYSSNGLQQIYSKDNDTVTYTPSWFSANTNTGVQITARVYIGGTSGATDVTGILSNRKFCLTQGGSAILTATTDANWVNDSGTAVTTPFTVTHDGTGSNIKIKGNLLNTAASYTLFFEGDYTDTITGLVSHIISQITLSVVNTGTNAVYVQIRGNAAIEQATGTTKSVTAVSADLVRSSGIDTTNLTYKWYDTNGGTQISTSTASYATKYGLKSVASGSPTATVTDLGVNIPVSGSGTAYASGNTLVISETAISNLAIFRVDITDSGDSKTYTQYFTVYDVSDKYQTILVSSSGDKLQNGTGSTSITPNVYYGANKVTDLTSWSFTWYLYDKNGNRGAFIDTAKISTAGGATISANTTGASATITYGGTSYAFVAGDIVKAVKPDGTAFFYEVASSTTNVVTIRTPTTNTWLNFTTFPAPSASTDFVNGKLYGCTTGGTRTSAAAASITVTGDEIDVKGNILCEANRP